MCEAHGRVNGLFLIQVLIVAPRRPRGKIEETRSLPNLQIYPAKRTTRRSKMLERRSIHSNVTRSTKVHLGKSALRQRRKRLQKSPVVFLRPLISLPELVRFYICVVVALCFILSYIANCAFHNIQNREKVREAKIRKVSMIIST